MKQVVGDIAASGGKKNEALVITISHPNMIVECAEITRKTASA